MRLWLIREGLAEDRRSGDLYELVDERWRLIPDERADAIAFNLFLDALPGPLGDDLRAVRALIVVHFMVRHGARLIEGTNARLAGVLRAVIGDGPWPPRVAVDGDVVELDPQLVDELDQELRELER